MVWFTVTYLGKQTRERFKTEKDIKEDILYPIVAFAFNVIMVWKVRVVSL